MRPLRILHLTTDGSTVAGAERVLLALGSAADRARWSLGFATVGPAGTVNELLAATGWPADSLGYRHATDGPAAVVRLARLVLAHRTDVLHAHLPRAVAFGALVAPVLGVPLVQTRHYSDYLHRFGTPAQRRVDRWAAARCAGIAGVSEAAREHLVQVERIPAVRVVVIENGVDWAGLSRIDPGPGRATLAALGVPAGPLVCCAASLHPRKGLHHLVDAFAPVVARVPAARLVLLGSGGERDALRERIRGRGLDDHVRLLGQRVDAHALIAACDVYVQPSVEEGFGLAVLEAMAMRRPVVVSDVGGMQITVENGVSGVRVPPGNPGRLAEALAGLLLDRAEAARLGGAASARVRDHYSVERQVAAYDRWYRSIPRVARRLDRL